MTANAKRRGAAARQILFGTRHFSSIPLLCFYLPPLTVSHSLTHAAASKANNRIPFKIPIGLQTTLAAARGKSPESFPPSWQPVRGLFNPMRIAPRVPAFQGGTKTKTEGSRLHSRLFVRCNQTDEMME